jgi:hypothetical protein
MRQCRQLGHFFAAEFPEVPLQLYAADEAAASSFVEHGLFGPARADIERRKCRSARQQATFSVLPEINNNSFLMWRVDDLYVEEELTSIRRQKNLMEVFLDNFFTVSVNSITEASHAIQAYIDDNDLLSSTFDGGQIIDDFGKVIAVVSYNGRVWEPKWNQSSTAWVVSDKEIIFDPDFSSRWDRFK